MIKTKRRDPPPPFIHAASPPDPRARRDAAEVVAGRGAVHRLDASRPTHLQDAALRDGPEDQRRGNRAVSDWVDERRERTEEGDQEANEFRGETIALTDTDWQRGNESRDAPSPGERTTLNVLFWSRFSIDWEVSSLY